MDMHVDQPRRHDFTGAVDRFRIRRRQGLTYSGDLPFFHQYVSDGIHS